MKTIEIIRNEQNNYFIREAFNTLRTNVLFSGKDVKTIIVTSCFAHEGKTTVSFNLCTSLAEAGKRVLLVDADLRKSAFITRYTKEKGVFGLSQVLSGQVDLSNAIYPTSVKGLDVIFTGPFPPNPTELVGSPAFRELLASQRPVYDYIIIDAPPLGLVIDAAVMGSFCDGAVLVINAGTVKRRVALDVKTQLEKSGTRLIGVVLNQIQKKSGRASTLGGGKRDQHYYSHQHAAHEAAFANVTATSNSSAASNNSTAIRRPSAPTAGASRPAASTPSTPVRRTPTAPDGRPMQTGAPTRPTAPTTPTTPTRPVGRVPSSPVRRPEEQKNDD